MLIFVTDSAECNQIQFVIGTLLAAQLLVVDLQVLSRAADLASPAVPTQDLLSQLFVRLGIESEARFLGANLTHEAFSITS